MSNQSRMVEEFVNAGGKGAKALMWRALLFIPRTLLRYINWWIVTKSLVLSFGMIRLLTLVVRWARRVLSAYAEIGPYADVHKHSFARLLQRVLVCKTRSSLKFDWFPTDSLSPVEARRSDNGHALSGSARDKARATIDATITNLGMRKFELSPAEISKKAAMRVGCTISSQHQHYAVGDLHQQASNDWPTKNEVIVGIDVDYYTDPHQLLASGQPAVFYTFNPQRVSGLDGECAYRITSDVVTYEVSGGATWEHQVWNWCVSGEFLESRAREDLGLAAWVRTCLGIERIVLHKVVHCRPWADFPDRVLVWCIPESSYCRFKWLPSSLRARTLKRVSYKDDQRPGWNRIVYSAPSGEVFTSLGRENEDLSVTLPVRHFDALRGLSTPQSVQTRLLGFGYDGKQHVVTNTLLCQYFLGTNVAASEVVRLSRSMQPTPHWPLNTVADVPELTSRTYGAPLVNDCNMMPMTRRWETLCDSLEQRVTFVANNKVPSDRIQRLAIEFVKLVVPENIAHTGVPYSVEDTATMLSKPSQIQAVKRIWETLDMPARPLIEAFVKNEPVMKAGRIVSSFNDARFLLNFSRYTLAFRDQVLHEDRCTHWFMPGKTPSEIANELTNYVRNIQGPIEGDFSNFDGTVSAWLQRHVMNAVYHRYFRAEYHRELSTFTDMLVSCPARAKKFGFQYEAGVGVKSGSPTTCDLNTVLNGFIQYCAVRITKPELTPEEAFAQIGLAFGDDSLFDALYKKAFVNVAKALGMDLKLEPIEPERGISFLARVYPDPWRTTTSFQEPLRTWRKLHLTTRDRNVPIADAATDRVEGYLVTDAFTPVTSHYCNMIKRVYAPECSDAQVRAARKDHGREKPYWLIESASWPQDVNDIGLMWKCISTRTGIPEEDLRLKAAFLDAQTDPYATEQFDRRFESAEYSGTVLPDGTPAVGNRSQARITELQNVTTNRAVPSKHASDPVRNDGPSKASEELRERAERAHPTRPGSVRWRGRSDEAQAHQREQVAKSETGGRGFPHRTGLSSSCDRRDHRRVEQRAANASGGQRRRDDRGPARDPGKRASRGGGRGGQSGSPGRSSGCAARAKTTPKDQVHHDKA